MATGGTESPPKAAEALAKRLAASLTASGIYPEGHPRRLIELDQLLELLSPQLDAAGEISFRLAGRSLSVGDMLLDEGLAAVSSIVTAMSRRGVEEIALSKGVTSEELSTILTCLQADPEAVRRAGGLVQAFADRFPLPNITVLNMRYELPPDARPTAPEVAHELTVQDALKAMCLLRGMDLGAERWRALEKMILEAEDLPAEVIRLIREDILGDADSDPESRRERVRQALEQVRAALKRAGREADWEALAAELARLLMDLDPDQRLDMIAAGAPAGTAAEDVLAKLDDARVAQIVADAAARGDPAAVAEVMDAMATSVEGLSDLASPIHEQIVARVGGAVGADIIQSAALELLSAGGVSADELDLAALTASGMLDPSLGQLDLSGLSDPGHSEAIRREAAAEHAEIMAALTLAAVGGDVADATQRLGDALVELLELCMFPEAHRTLLRVLGDAPSGSYLPEAAGDTLLDGIAAHAAAMTILVETLAEGASPGRRSATEIALLLGHRMADRLFETLVTSPETSVRRNVFGLLVRVGPQAVDRIARHLADGDPDRIAMAVRVLGEAGTDEAARRVLSAAAHNSPAVRRAVARVGAQLGVEWGARIGALLAHDADPAIQASAIRLLAAAPLPESVPLLTELALNATREQPETQREAIVALGAFPTRATVDALAEVVRGGRWRRRIGDDLRLAAVASLRTVATAEAVQALAELARSTRGAVSQACAKAATELSDGSASV